MRTAGNLARNPQHPAGGFEKIVRPLNCYWSPQEDLAKSHKYSSSIHHLTRPWTCKRIQNSAKKKKPTVNLLTKCSFSSHLQTKTKCSKVGNSKLNHSTATFIQLASLRGSAFRGLHVWMHSITQLLKPWVTSACLVVCKCSLENCQV